MVDLCKIVDTLTGCGAPERIITSKDPKGRYSRISVNLEEAYTDEEYHLAGNFIGVSFISGGGSCIVKLDYIGSQGISLREVQTIKSAFDRLYITSDGNGGTAILYICQAMETLISPNVETPWQGVLRNYSLISTNIVRRVDDWHHKANTFKIRNTDAANGVDIGYVPYTGDLPATSDFRDISYRLIAQAEMELTEVDLMGIGFVSTNDDAHAQLKMMGSMR